MRKPVLFLFALALVVSCMPSVIAKSYETEIAPPFPADATLTFDQAVKKGLTPLEWVGGNAKYRTSDATGWGFPGVGFWGNLGFASETYRFSPPKSKGRAKLKSVMIRSNLEGISTDWNELTTFAYQNVTDHLIAIATYSDGSEIRSNFWTKFGKRKTEPEKSQQIVLLDKGVRVGPLTLTKTLVASATSGSSVSESTDYGSEIKGQYSGTSSSAGSASARTFGKGASISKTTKNPSMKYSAERDTDVYDICVQVRKEGNGRWYRTVDIKKCFEGTMTIEEAQKGEKGIYKSWPRR